MERDVYMCIMMLLTRGLVVVGSVPDLPDKANEVSMWKKRRRKGIRTEGRASLFQLPKGQSTCTKSI